MCCLSVTKIILPLTGDAEFVSLLTDLRYESPCFKCMQKINSAHLVTLVDHSGNVTGYAEKIEAHLRGQLHLAFSLMITRKRNNQTEYLLQKRATHKYHSGGLWTNTCCSHPMPQERIKDATQRRVFEELGITRQLELSIIGQICYRHSLDNDMIEHELDNILVAEVKELHWQQNPNEVCQVAWWSEKQVSTALSSDPSQFTAWFEQVFEEVKQHSSQSCCLS